MGAMMMQRKRLMILIPLLVLLFMAAGCRPSWEINLEGLEQEEISLTFQTWEEYADFEIDGQIPLEQILYGLGARIIEEITIVDRQGEINTYDWQEIAEELFLSRKGRLVTSSGKIDPARMEISLSPWEERVQIGIYDITPTAALALGIAPPETSTGEPLQVDQAPAVLLLFLDGFGYLRYQESLAEGLIPVLVELDSPLVGLTTYPPVTTVSSASLLTGAEPPDHGVEIRGIRETELETILDAAAQAGLEVAAIEGEALAFNLRSAEITLSGDRDGDGGTDDNVLANTLAALENGMPDLLYVHFHGIDDQGHEVGPGAPSEAAKIQEVDAAVGQILERLPDGTLVIIFADHGMHWVEDGYGTHGNLIERNMLIPVWITIIDSYE